MQWRLSLGSVILYLFILNTILVTSKPSSFTALADSPSIDRQEIENKNKWKWEQIDLNLETAEDIHDGRKIFFKTANDISQCNNTELFEKFPDITSVSYFSDGKTLNTTFWLDRPPLINDYYQGQERAEDIEQVSVQMDIVNLKNRIWTQDIEKSQFIDKIFDGVKMINTTTLTLDNNLAYALLFSARLNYSTLGHPTIIAMDVFTIKNEKIYRFLYLAEPSEFLTQLPTVTEMIYSFKVINIDNYTSDKKGILSPASIANNNSTNAITSAPYTEVKNSTQTYKDVRNGIEVNYPSNWKNTTRQGEGVTSTIFFSPIKGPYLIGTGYIISIDVPSVYETDTDFVAKVMWWDSLYNHTWFKLDEEISFNGTTSTIKETSNSSQYFEKQKNSYSWKPHVVIPIDLKLMNLPSQYLIVFVTEAKYIKDGFLCELIQKTDQVSAPPPKFSILPSVNSTTVGPGQVKTIEVQVKSLSDIPYNISLSANAPPQFMNATFDPPVIQIPPSGWASSQLTIVGNSTAASMPSSNTKTLSIVAKPEIMEKGNHFIFNTNRSISSIPAAVATNQTLGLTITVFNYADFIAYTLNSIGAPLSTVVAIAGLIGGIIGWVVKRQ